MVSRDLTLSWGGVEREFCPDFRYLRRLDAKLRADPDRKSDLLRTALTVLAGGEEWWSLPIVWADMLAAAGFDGVGEDDCYRCIVANVMHEADAHQKAAYLAFAAAITAAVLPDVDLEKKADALPEPATAQG